MKITEPSFSEEEIDQVRAVLASKWVTQGPMTERFEKLVADRHGVKFAIACTSCTAALHLAAMGLELKADDEVIVPAFTWITSANAAEYVGARVVFADVDVDTYNIEPAKLEAAITPRTKAVIAVHLFGLASPMDEIAAICAPRNIVVIEDAACAIGTNYKGRPVGGIGDIGCFSFHPRKVITTGEGGMVTTNREDLAIAVRSLRNHGATGTPDPSIEPHGPWTMASFNRLGFNLRFSDIQAAVGVAQMSKLEHLLRERRARAQRYSSLLAGLQELATPDRNDDAAGHSYQSYVVRITSGGRKRRNEIMRFLAEESIDTRPGTHAVHRLGYYANKYRYQSEDFPKAALCEDTTITLPLFPGMTDGDQDKVVELLAAAVRS